MEKFSLTLFIEERLQMGNVEPRGNSTGEVKCESRRFLTEPAQGGRWAKGIGRASASMAGAVLDF